MSDYDLKALMDEINQRLNEGIDPTCMALMDLIDQRVNEYIGPTCVVRYSAYRDDAEDHPIDNLDEIAVQGKVQFWADSDDFWGGPDCQSYESPVLENPTWLELCKHANDMILVTLDEHHHFLEGVRLIGEHGEIQHFEFVMGS